MTLDRQVARRRAARPVATGSGADPRNTNYAGGNTSAKGTAIDPATGEPVELLWVKGSGGDLGTLTEAGLAVLRLDRLRGLVDVYPGVEREDEMVAAFDYCLHGRGGAAPSIDTAMHGLRRAGPRRSPAPGLRDRPRDGRRRRGADPPMLRRPRGLGPVAASRVPARPRHRRDPARPTRGDRRDPRRPRDHGLGRRPRRRARRTPSTSSGPRSGSSRTKGGRSRSAPACPSYDAAARRPSGATRAAALFPLAARPRLDGPAPGRALHRQRRRPRLPRPARPIRGSPRSGRRAPTTSCGRRSGRWSSTCRRRRRSRTPSSGCGSCTPRTATSTPRTTRATPSPDSPPMRGADPAIVLVPGVGMFSFGATKQTARVAGEFYVNAINVMRGAEAALDLRAHPGSRRSSGSSTGRSRRRSWPGCPAPKPLAGRGRVGDRRGVRDRQGDRPPPRRRKGPASSSPTSTRSTPRRSPASSAGRTSPRPVVADVTDEAPVVGRVPDRGPRVRRRRPRRQQRRPVDLQAARSRRPSGLGPPARRHGPRVVPRLARGGPDHDRAGMGGDLVYIVSKNAFFAGPNNVAYGAAKADQAHQVRLLAAELGEFGIRVNGVNPDGVVRGSGIFAKGWGADRARTYGIPEDQLGEFYAQRTILKREVLPGARRGGRVRPRRRATCRRRPGSTSRWTPGSRPRSCGDRAAPSPRSTSARRAGASSSGGSGRRAAARRGPPLPQRSGRRCPTGCTGTCQGSYRGHRGPAARRRASGGAIASIGIDSWGVDYGLVDERGALVGEPFHYRDARTARRRRAGARRRAAGRGCTRSDGLQLLPFNTLYQLAADDPADDSRRRRRCC